MKKTLTIIMVMVLTIALSFSTANAVISFKVALSASSTSVSQGQEVVITVNLRDFTSGETGINAMLGTIDYDQTVFETLAATSLASSSGWSSPTFNPANGEFAMDNSSFMSENHTLMQITFKVKSNAPTGSTKITLKELNAADGLEDIIPSDQSITLTIKAGSGTSSSSSKPTSSSTSKVPSSSTSSMPSTGVVDYVLPAIGVIAVLGVIAYVRYNRIEK